ncbi:MFS transporter [Nocardioides guangzhouensis]|uniref:MFS transporter n=1 Tax=Nocardioides guangzhouensis TaxID=2497878 RepID=A0A4Q4Z9S9_9ACTN|nr:MFS transporter [Nocardioides guangzhouensis]RYP84632.1 MFS transporter [Nocardioides guangzhouensis]
MEAIAPARMGRSFRWLLASSWTTNIGDGLALASGPLLIASQTHDPFLVALAVLLQRLPWLLFGLQAGALADRLDRRLLVVVVDGARAVVLAALAFTIITGAVSIGLVLTTMFLLGVAEVFADTTTGTLLPMVVEKADLGIGNARIMAGMITANQMVGPPIGAALFALGMYYPFVLQAVCVALGAFLVSRMVTPPLPPPAEPTHIRQDIREGFRWTWGHAPVRTLTLAIVTFNVTFGAAWSVLVLYSIRILGMGEIGFGMLTSVGAVGGLLGTLSYDWLERHFSLARIMRVGLVIETLTHLALAVNTSFLIALVIMFVFGAHAFIWGTTSRTVRMRAVPTEFQGRVGSVYLVGVFGGLVVGNALGGLIASAWGVTAPFWFAFMGSAVILALIWRELEHIAHADEQVLASQTAYDG